MSAAYRLSWVNRDGGEVVYHLVDGATVGRSSENEIVVDEDGVSRRHCRFKLDHGRLRVLDLGSTNGTYVNGRRVQDEPVDHGDMVLVGRSLFEIRDASGRSQAGQTAVVGAETIQVALRAAEADDPGLLNPEARVSDHLRTLCRVIEIINDGGSTDELYDKTLSALVELLGVDYAAVLLGGDPEAAPVASVGGPDVPSRTVLRRVFGEGEAVLANDVGSDSKIGGAESLIGDLHTRILCAPILRHGSPLGALYLKANAGSRPITESELRLVSIVARSLAMAAENIHQHEVVKAENETLRRATSAGQIVGVSESIRTILEIARRAARSDATVLITGETGTGKELFARAIHDWSPRAERPFVAINCGAIPASMVESELFGHEKGAFTGAVERRIGRFEMARDGTLFLDEIGDLPLDLQVKLLRVIEEKRFYRVGGTQEVQTDVRLVAATHRDLDQQVEQGEFRRDLLYRVRVLEIALPPLRERQEDIVPIAEHLLAHLAERGGYGAKRLGPAAQQRLAEYTWPGNVRELRNVLERALILCGSDTIEPDDVLLDRGEPSSVASSPASSMSLKDLEALHIKAVLDETGWNKSKAAELLGIGRTNIYEKIKQYGLTPDD